MCAWVVDVFLERLSETTDPTSDEQQGNYNSCDSCHVVKRNGKGHTKNKDGCATEYS